MNLLKLWIGGLVNWRVPRVVAVEQRIVLAVLAVATVIGLPYAVQWPLWAQITSGAGVVLLFGLANGLLRAMAER